MSATNRGSKRAEADYYPTPAWCVHRLLDARSFGPGSWLEPAAGQGHLIRAVNQWHTAAGISTPIWRGVELREDFAGVNVAQGVPTLIGDFPAIVRKRANDISGMKQRLSLDARVIITNPPFSQSVAFIEAGLALQPDYLILLLRLNFLGCSVKRRKWLTGDLQPSVYVIPQRPSFTGDGRTDATEYAWFVWSRLRKPEWLLLDDTPKDERSNRSVRKKAERPKNGRGKLLAAMITAAGNTDDS